MRSFIPVNQCRLYKCSSRKRLAEILMIQKSELDHRKKWISYHLFDQPKEDGGTRTIYNPNDNLKAVQRRINKLLSRIERPNWLYSSCMGRSHVDNGKHHEGRPYLLTADISQFYERCTRESVYQYFLNTMKTAPDVAEALTDLTTYTYEDGRTVIPSGSPCGQTLAFFAYEKMFFELHTLAQGYQCSFSLYVDDMTMSSQIQFHHVIEINVVSFCHLPQTGNARLHRKALKIMLRILSNFPR